SLTSVYIRSNVSIYYYCYINHCMYHSISTRLSSDLIKIEYYVIARIPSTEILAEYVFSWDNGPIMNGNNTSFVYDGDFHNLKIYKEECIVVDTNFNVVFPRAVTLDATDFDVTCHTSNDEQMNAMATGRYSNYTLSMNKPH